jgi:hypothetical protein
MRAAEPRSGDFNYRQEVVCFVFPFSNDGEPTRGRPPGSDPTEFNVKPFFSSSFFLIFNW